MASRAQSNNSSVSDLARKNLSRSATVAYAILRSVALLTGFASRAASGAFKAADGRGFVHDFDGKPARHHQNGACRRCMGVRQRAGHFVERHTEAG